MKFSSIRNRKVLLLCLVLFCGVAAIIGAYCLSKEPHKTEGNLALTWEPQKEEGNFFEIVGFSADDVKKVSIRFEDIALDFSPKNQARLLESLAAAQGQLLHFDHPYPYYVGDYQIQLHVNGEVLEFPFAWFNGYEHLITGSGDLAKYSTLMEYVDRRVDVQIGDKWFTFQQSEDLFGNEDISFMAYNAAQREEDRIQASFASDGGGLVKDTPDYSDPSYFIDRADVVLLAKHTSREYVYSEDPGYTGCQIPTDRLKVVEVLKGEYDLSNALTLTGYAPALDAEGKIQKSPWNSVLKGGLDSGYAYISEPGVTYLLFLEAADYLAEPRLALMPSCNRWLAKIYNDTAYACVNHENHAFLELPLSEIRALCNTDIINQP